MKNLIYTLLVVCLVLPVTIFSQFQEFFDTYPTGQDLHGINGWKGWENNPTFTAFTSDVERFSSPNSVAISGSSDLVREISGINSGVWSVSARSFVPTGFSGDNFFILLNSYDDAGTTNNWSTQIHFQSFSGGLVSDNDNNSLPIIFDQWVEIQVVIDFDANLQSIYYGGNLLVEKSWTDGVSGGGSLNLAAIDLFANGASPVYYDNILVFRGTAIPTLGQWGIVMLSLLFLILGRVALLEKWSTRFSF